MPETLQLKSSVHDNGEIHCFKRLSTKLMFEDCFKLMFEAICRNNTWAVVDNCYKNVLKSCIAKADVLLGTITFTQARYVSEMLFEPHSPSSQCDLNSAQSSSITMYNNFCYVYSWYKGNNVW